VSASLYVKDPAASRFVAGGIAEVEDLLGAPLPDLPTLERDQGRDVFLIHTHHQLRTHLHRYLEALLSQIGAYPARSTDTDRDVAQYEQALAEVLLSLRAVDRRQGLLNLFWLAHSRQAAEHLRDLESRAPALKRGKLSLFPLLQSFYKRMDSMSRRQTEGEPPPSSAGENAALVASLIDDGFAFTEVSAAELDLSAFLAGNKRYRISPDLFFEIQQVLVREAERRFREGDRGLLARTSRHLPGLPREHYLKPANLVKIVLSEPVLTCLLADPLGAGARLATSPLVQAEAERKRSGEVFEAFLDLAIGLRRFEILSSVRERIVDLDAVSEAHDLDEMSSRGLRVYEFGEAAQVLNHAVPATVLFLDLRGFTSTSEGQISERDLTRELYEVFDDFVPIIDRFGGTVDKYLGDGMMVTWGTARADPLDPLNALRAAVLCQESLRQKRESGRTFYKMGIAIHHGRVYLARFIAAEGVQATVIGRNVNLAGRLSSATKRPVAGEEEGLLPIPGPDASARLQVKVDEDGMLFNEGIALSRETLVQLESQLALVETEQGMEYEDEATGWRLVIRYAGDAKFKGVRSSMPVYTVRYTDRG